MALTKVSTPGIKDEAITLAKLLHGDSNSNGKFLRANNGADPTFETVNTDLVSDTSPQLSGPLDCQTHNISLSDSSGTASGRVKLGEGDDIQLYHNGSHSYFDNSTGTLHIRGQGDGIRLQKTNGEDMAKFIPDGAVELYNDNNKKFETLSDGVNINGASFDTHLKILGNKFLGRARWGYSTSYSGVTLGRTDATFNSTIFMGVDTSANASGAFTGDGREVVFRNNHRFIIPNAANNGYLASMILNGGAATEGVPRFPSGVLFGNDTANANILDDYEEGSFTPSLLVGGSDSGIVYSYQVGQYVKIGRQVTVNMYITISNKGSNSGNIHFGNLPFAVADTLAGTQHEASGSVGYISGVGTNSIFFTVTAVPSPSALLFTQLGAASSALVHATQAHLSNSFGVRCSCTYFTNA